MKIRIIHNYEILWEGTNIIPPNQKDLWTVKDGPTYQVIYREFVHEYDEHILNVYTEWLTGNS